MPIDAHFAFTQEYPNSLGDVEHSSGLSLPPKPKVKPPQPLVGATMPYDKRLMEIPEDPEDVTDGLLEVAYEAIARFGATYPDEMYENSSEYERMVDDMYCGVRGRIRFFEARQDFFMIAVHKMWQHHDPERFLKLLKKVGRTSKRGNSVYKLSRRIHDANNSCRLTAPQSSAYLVYNCPSTGKLHITGIPDRYYYKTKIPRRADSAMAWMLKLNLKQYDQLKIEA